MSEIVVKRAGDGWFVDGVGRVRLRDVRQMAKGSGQQIRWPEPFDELVFAVESADERVAAANRESVRSRVALAIALQEQGVTSMSEIGAVLNVSRQRVHALLQTHHGRDDSA